MTLGLCLKMTPLPFKGLLIIGIPVSLNEAGYQTLIKRGGSGWGHGGAKLDIPNFDPN